MHTDRRQIEGLLGPYFPTMEGASSDDWHAFLNAQTGLEIPIGADNSSAFDEWRKVIATQGYPEVWPYSAHQEEAFKARGIELAQKASEWRAEQSKLSPSDHWLVKERAALKEARKAAKGRP